MPHYCARSRAALPEIASFSSGVPTVTRRQFASSGCAAVEILDEDAALLQTVEYGIGVGHADQHEIGVARERGRRRAAAQASLPRRAALASIVAACLGKSVVMPQAHAPPRLRQRVDIIRRANLVQLRRSTPARPTA